MIKSELKTLIPSLNAGDAITIAFVGDRREHSGTFEVVRTRRGRGKGGSQLLDLRGTDDKIRPLNENGFFVTGTPENEAILHIITEGGTLHGFENESDVPPVFETDRDGHITGEDVVCPCGACRLKRAFTPLAVMFAPPAMPASPTIRVTSTYEPFNGSFSVTGATQLRGRYGQVRLECLTDTGETFMLWSNRHSKVITAFEIVTNF